MKNDDDLTLDEFFDFDIEEVAEPRKNVIGNLLGLLSLSVVAGLVMSVGVAGVPQVFATGAQPVVDTWNSIPSKITEPRIGEKTVLKDSKGRTYASLWRENRTKIDSIEKVSPNVVDALVATEDHSFYDNNGFSPKGVVRAAITGRGGGSGITQQLVKNLQFYDLENRHEREKAVEHSYARKVRELRLAVEYDRTHTKNEILIDYLNVVAFGSPTTYGVETASNRFFGKSSRKLTVAEAAILVGTVQNPVKFDLSTKKGRKAAISRSHDVLDRMVDEKKITKQERTKALRQKIAFTDKKQKNGTCADSDYPFYCEYVVDSMRNDPRLGETREEREFVVDQGGFIVSTYLDRKTMNVIDRYMKQNWGNENRIIAPTAVIDPSTGGVLAFGANRRYGTGKGATQVNLPLRPAGEGSTYKMFTLAAALNQGGLTENELSFSSQCPLNPGPDYDAPAGGFKNSNSCGLQGGFLNYKQATAYSSNTWYVTLERRIGVTKVKEFSKSVGLAAPDSVTDRTLAYTLGVVGNSPVADAAAFATFANKGVYCPPSPIKSMERFDGQAIIPPSNFDPSQVACRRVLSPKDAGTVLKAMRANVSGEIPGAFGARSNIPGQDNGGKSGTNENFNSAWVHLTEYYSLFTNVYDMDRPTRGVDGAVFRGYPTTSSQNTAQTTGSDIMKQLHAGKPRGRLNFESNDDSLRPVPVDYSQFVTVPSVIGLEPSIAIQVMKNAGLEARVTRQKVSRKAGQPSGVIVDQSLEPGRRFPKGSVKTVILKPSL